MRQCVPTAKTWTDKVPSRLMPTLNEKFPAPNGLDHPAVSGLLLVCGITIMIALVLTLAGLLRKKAAA